MKKKREKDLPVMEQEALKLFPLHPTKRVASMTGVKETRIRKIAHIYGYKKLLVPWSGKDELYLLNNYLKIPAREIGVKLGRTRSAVINKWNELNKPVININPQETEP